MQKKIAVFLLSFFLITGCLVLSSCFRLYTAPRFTTPDFFIKLTNDTQTAVGVRVVWEGQPGNGWEKTFFLKPSDIRYLQDKLTIYPMLTKITVQIVGCGTYTFPNYQKKEASRVFVTLRANMLNQLVCNVNVEYVDTLLSREDTTDSRQNFYAPPPAV